MMRTSLSLILAGLGLASLISCGGSKGAGSTTDPVGKWVTDPAAVEAILKEAAKASGETVPPEIMDAMKEAAKSMKLEFDIRKDGTYSASINFPAVPGMGAGGSTTSKGTWKLNGKDMEFTKTEEDGKPSKDKEVLTAKFTGSSMEVQVPNGGPLLSLKRA